MADTVDTSVDTSVETTLKGKQATLVQRIVQACDKAESSATTHYIKTGGLCAQFVALYVQDGGKSKDGKDILKGKLAEAGLRNLDVSTFIKSNALSTLCPTVADVPVSVLVALLPLCSAKGEAPSWVEGVSGDSVVKMVTKIIANKVPATKVRTQVNDILGNGATTEKKAWEKCVATLDKVDDKTLLAALRNNGAIQDRVRKLLAKLDAKEEAKEEQKQAA